jgi:Helix-turn-helix domain
VPRRGRNQPRDCPSPGLPRREGLVQNVALRTYSITEAADITGLSRKAIARRVERGSLRSLVRNGRRRIPRSELTRAGLLPESDPEAPEFDPASLLLPRSVPGEEVDVPAQVRWEQTVTALFRELLDRFERQSAEVAQFRALTVQAESLRLTNELADLRLKIAELEREREREPSSPQLAGGELSKRMTELSKQVEELSRREIWLPPQAAGRRPVRATAPVPPQPPAPPRAPSQQAASRPSRARGRAVRFPVEVTLLVLVAVAAWQADLGAKTVAVVMTVAWAVVATAEWFFSRRS